MFLCVYIMLCCTPRVSSDFHFGFIRFRFICCAHYVMLLCIIYNNYTDIVYILVIVLSFGCCFCFLLHFFSCRFKFVCKETSERSSVLLIPICCFCWWFSVLFFIFSLSLSRYQFNVVTFVRSLVCSLLFCVK